MLPPLPFPSIDKHLPSPMPPLGTPSRSLWTFQSGWTNLNHGSYGAVPSAVLAVQREWTTKMEANPETFIRFHQYPTLDVARAALAKYIKADADDVVLIDNASHGMNAVLRSLAERLPRGSLLLDLNLAYTMVKNTFKYCAEVFGHTIVTANVTLTPQATDLEDQIVHAVEAALIAHKGAIKLLSVSHITSVPAIVLPVKRLSALAHAHGALIVVDGAHALGNVALDVPSIGADFYVANGHKWLVSPKGSALMWVSKAQQHLIYPTTISQEGQGTSRFLRDFSYQGTADPTAWLSMAASLDFRARVPGGEAAILKWNHDLASAGGDLLAKLWKTETLLPSGRSWSRCTMVNVRLPTDNATASHEVPLRLVSEYNTFVPCFPGVSLGLPNNSYWCRISAYLYNDIDDFRMLGKAVMAILGIKEHHQPNDKAAAGVEEAAVMKAAEAKAPIAWVFESEEYTNALKSALTTDWKVYHCGGGPDTCPGYPSRTGNISQVQAVIGRADNTNLSAIPHLKLVQSADFFHTDGSRVPARSAIADFSGWWPAKGDAQIAEFVIASIFEQQYHLTSRSRSFRQCAFATNAAASCDAPSIATNHTMVSELTIGVLGYGHIGKQVASRASALGATVIATKRTGPFNPPPPGLKWLSSDNDRLYKEADVIVSCVPGSVKDVINATSLKLMKSDALLIPISAAPVDFTALAATLSSRPAFRAVLDVWPSGCWHFPNITCGPPLGQGNWPAESDINLPNVMPLAGMAMRDAVFWRDSVTSVAGNLDRLASGKPLKNVVRNATA